VAAVERYSGFLANRPTRKLHRASGGLVAQIDNDLIHWRARSVSPPTSRPKWKLPSVL
jgi:hypothetical protein